MFLGSDERNPHLPAWCHPILVAIINGWSVFTYVSMFLWSSCGYHNCAAFNGAATASVMRRGSKAKTVKYWGHMHVTPLLNLV
jgi:hypothetical protein